MPAVYMISVPILKRTVKRICYQLKEEEIGQRCSVATSKANTEVATRVALRGIFKAAVTAPQSSPALAV